MSETQLAVIVGENIVLQRKRIGLSQKELAAKLNITQESMGRIEKGKIAPKMGRLQEIADALQCTVASLFQNSAPEVHDRAMTVATLLEKLPEGQQQAVISAVYTIVGAFKKEK